MFKKGDFIIGTPSAKEYEFANSFMLIGSVDEVYGDGTMLVTVIKHAADDATGDYCYEGEQEEVEMCDFELLNTRPTDIYYHNTTSTRVHSMDMQYKSSISLLDGISGLISHHSISEAYTKAVALGIM